MPGFARGMTKDDKKPGRLTQVLLETAKDMRGSGIMSQEACAKIAMRHLGANAKAGVVEPQTGEEIRAMREQGHMSQAVFAYYLNLTVGYLSQLERGAKRPGCGACAVERHSTQGNRV